MLKENSARMPALFLGHGNPMNAIDENLFVDSLKRVGKTLPRPKAVLVISAHWTTPYSAVSLHESELYYDMYGFPKELYMVSYPAKSADFLIAGVQELIKDLRVQKRALDHGVWSVLVHLFPDADIPVLQMSINTNFSMQEHYEMGKVLSVLREEGVMIVGSGNVTHNLREANLSNKDAPVDTWAKEFDEFVKDALIRRDFDALVNFEKLQRYADRAHPTKEHFIPLLYIAGASNNDKKSSFVYQGFEHANLSMRCWKTGE